MVKHFQRVLACIFIAALVLVLSPAIAVRASLASCGASSSPNSVEPGSQNPFGFQLNNTDYQAVQYIKITRPSADFHIDSTTADDWVGGGGSISTSYDQVELSNGNIPPGASINFSITATASNNTAPSAPWNVTASDDPWGAGAINCDGSTSVDIANAPPPQIAISNVRATNLNSSSVTILWDTNVTGTSQINYGLDNSYGNSTDLDSNMVTSHNQTITGLSANTAYHYQLVSNDSQGNNATSDDSTFLTAVTPAPGTKIINQAPSINIVISNPGDKVPPTISLTTQLPKIVQNMPVIKGTASDDVAIMRVEYSTDGGQNWLPVDSAPTLGAKQVPFSFTPINLDDGNYTIIVRAIDGGGNIAATTPITVVVDRLPPLVGGALISLGPQILPPDSNNVITTLAGIDQKITMSAVGGPTSITINATQVGAKTNKEKVFSLTQDVNSGLWSGILSFEQAGVYGLVAHSIDGAGNTTSHSLNTINVSSAARVVQRGTNKALKAQLKLYTYDNDTSSWILWDGSPFGQTNPQTTGTNGSFKLFLPPGKYYLAVTADDHKPVVSNIFNLQQTTPLTTQLNMNKATGIKIGPIHLSWPSFSSEAININPVVPKVAQSVNPNKLINKSLPDLSLPGTNANNVTSISWLGRPTLLSFMASWLPSTSEQLKPLSELQTNKDINIVPIALQENADKMRVYTQTAGYSLNWLVDPDSTLTNVVNIQSLPTHYFINRDGVVKKIITGILTEQQITDNLSAL